MNWTQIEGSTAIGRVGYDEVAKVMGIETLKGAQYFYRDVRPSDYESFMAEPSKGKAWSHIKKVFPVAGASTTLQQATVPVGEPVIMVPSGAPLADVLSPKPHPGTILALSFDAITANESEAVIPFEDMVASLRQRTEEYCAPVVETITKLTTDALAIIVSDAASYEAAAAKGTELAKQRQLITETLRSPKQSIDKVKYVFLEKEHEMLDVIAQGENYLSQACTNWRKAENERARIAAKAEEDRKKKEAEDRRLEDARKASDAGRQGLADKLLSTPVATPRVEVKTEVPQTTARGKIVYKFRVADMAQVPDMWKIIDEKAVGAFARAKKLPDKTILNGIEFYQEEDTSF